MKKIIIILLSLFCAWTLRGQILGTVQNVGFVQEQKTVSINGQSYLFGVVGGGVVNTQNQSLEVDQGLADNQWIMSGFPHPITYFPILLDHNFFVSKGFFSNYTQLQWNVLVNNHSISQFQLFRKPLGEPGDSVLIATLGPDVFSYQDETSELGLVNEYTLFARGIADNLRLPFVNFIQGEGFSFPAASVSGQVNFEGGTAVEGVTVLSTTEGNLKGKSVELDGITGNMRVVHTEDDDEMNLESGATIQIWTKFTGDQKGVLFSKGSDFELTYDGLELIFKVGDAQVTMNYINPIDSFFHVSAVFDPGNELRLHAMTSKNSHRVQKSADGSSPVIGNATILFGRNKAGNYYKGFLDELRVWQKPLTETEILGNFERHIDGREEGLSGYWRLDMGAAGRQFYDFARRGADFLENHGVLVGNAQFRDDTPYESQLSFKGVTDQFGNYTITGFPYETSGSLYKFTPILPFHEFEPSQQVRFVGTGASIQNEVDFKDISSFEVSGTVTYEGGPFPVEGVSILIDGRPAFNADGQLILTDNLGRFTINVPIGLHSLKLNMPNHTFVNEGRFPAATAEDPLPLYDFREPLAGLEFIDNTKVKIAGRIVGGPIEADKPLGFSLSKNNIGNATIHLTTQKGFDLVHEADASPRIFNETQAGETINAEMTLATRNVEINADPETGEFLAFLPPEQYRVTAVTAGNHTFDDSYLITVDLRSTTIPLEETFSDTVAMETNGETLPGFIAFDSEDYDSIYTYTREDTVYSIAIDTFKLQARQDFILRNRPIISVSDHQKRGFLGEENIVFADALSGNEQVLPLYNESEGTYSFGHPVFRKFKGYKIDIEVFEEYTNADNGNEVDLVPVIDGIIKVDNNLGESTETELRLDSLGGRVVYQFLASALNFSLDPNDFNNDFTQSLNITAFTGNDGSIKTIYNEGNPLRGIVLGGREDSGSNFVTKGPLSVSYILRDPPGSGSSATLSSGLTISTNITLNSLTSLTQGNVVKVKSAPDVVTELGLGSSVQTNLDNTNNITTNSSLGLDISSNTTLKMDITTNQSINTSSDKLLVGSSADIFIGQSTNLVYGVSTFLEPIPSDNCDFCGGKEFQGFKLGTRKDLTIDPAFETSFIYTQYHIENVLLPDLINLRNNFLNYVEDVSTVEAIDEPIYVSRLPRTDHRFGSSNTDEKVWGDLASDVSSDGPSYIVIYPSDDDLADSDTIDYFNKDIEGWKQILLENEQAKKTASLEENFSFDAGTDITNSKTISKGVSRTRKFEFTIKKNVANELGAEVNDKGIVKETSVNFTESNSIALTGGINVSDEVSYTLSDSDIGDSYSIDVLETDDGHSPAFKVRGGRSSCPHESGEITKYYLPGTSLGAGTLQREKPRISVVESVVSNVPMNRVATFTILLDNDSETGEDRFFNLFFSPASNPFGAEIEVGGEPIGNGLAYYVEAGKTLPLTITIRPIREDIFNYENIKLLLASPCQFNPLVAQEDIFDTVEISAYFVPGCSDIEILSPRENWVINTNTPQEDVLPVKIGGYNLNTDNFKRIQFQYRAAGTAAFTTDMTFYNALQVSQEEFEAANEPKMLITEGEFTYPFDMSDLPDQVYDIRAVAYCDAGPGLTYETPTDILRGTKDTSRPRLFGAPQPADGILSVDEEIKITFNESIAGSRLTASNFTVEGVLNDATIDDRVSLNLDGQSDYVRIEDGADLNGSFTIELKLKRNELGREMVIFSKGYHNSDYIEIGFNEKNALYVEVAGERKVSNLTFTDLLQFIHLAISYDAESKEYFAYDNAGYVLERVKLPDNFSGIGPVALGTSTINNDRFLNANLLDFRIWDRFLPLADVTASIPKLLTGSEIGLVGYWLFNEGFGDLAVDRARFRNAKVFSDWIVLPAGSSVAFDGVDDYLKINTASTVVISDESDFTIEFWYNGVKGQNNAVLFSSGRGANGTDQENIVDDPAKSFSIGFNEAGQLFMASNGRIHVVDIPAEELLDQNWHHLALSVSKIGNANLYLDGLQVYNAEGGLWGGVQRVTMTIGARGYNSGTNTEVQDMFFEGLIDEFRIWGSARTGEQVRLGTDSRLTGEELGLLAYYPFDAYEESTGIEILQTSLADQLVNPFGPNGGAATNAGSTFSANTPNIKPPRPVKSVPFDFVVNENEIIIELGSSVAHLLEGAIVEITAANMEDQFENRLASPVTFTALINRNRVVWDKDQLEVEKLPNEPYSFSVDIVNLGGTEESFEIVNLPLWLTASPQSSTVSPQSRISVEFTVNPGLNNGYYNEDIFLTTDFGFNEELNLSLEVLEPAPDWQLDPASFQFSMSIVASLEVNGIISRDENDLLAAFVNDSLRGRAQLRYVPEFDQYMAFLDIYSNNASEDLPIEFRAFDAEDGVEYRQLTPLDAVFTNNATLGTPSVPLVLKTGTLRSETISFERGYSWRSFNLNSAVLDSSNLLLSQVEATTNDKVSVSQFFDVYEDSLGWVGTISQSGGYQLDTYYLFYLQNGGSIDLTGTLADPETGIKITEGFNRIGYIPDFFLSVNEAFSRIQPVQGDIVRGQFSFAVYEEGLGWIGSLENLEPGQGYVYYSKDPNEKTLRYPDDSFLSNDAAEHNLNDREERIWEFQNIWDVDAHLYPRNMPVIAFLDVAQPERFAIAAFDEQGLVGTSVPSRVGNEWQHFLTIYGNTQAKTVSFKAFDRSNGDQYQVRNLLEYQPGQLKGSNEVPVILELAELVEESEEGSYAYPNPFENEVIIHLSKPSRVVRYEVHDANGHLIAEDTLEDEKKIRQLIWNAGATEPSVAASGVYFIKVMMEGRVDIVKVIKY